MRQSTVSKVQPGWMVLEIAPGAFRLNCSQRWCSGARPPAGKSLEEKPSSLALGVAAQVDPFESKLLKPVFHFIDSRLKG
jgi:hypothetical protein